MTKVVISKRGPIRLGWDMIYMMALKGHPLAVEKMRLLPTPHKKQRILLTPSPTSVYIMENSKKSRYYVDSKDWDARDYSKHQRGEMMTDDFNREDPILIQCVEEFPKDEYNIRNYYLDTVTVKLAPGQTYCVTNPVKGRPEHVIVLRANL